jgi:rRNA biogenesis protein RRP5
MEVDSGKKTKKKKDKKEKKSRKEEEGQEGENLEMTEAEAAALKGIAVEAPKFVGMLRYNAVERGMQLLGAVREVHELYALVALPNGLKGKLTLTEYSDTLTEHLQKSMNKASMDEDEHSDNDYAPTNDAGVKTNQFASGMSQLVSVGQILRLASIKTSDSAVGSKNIELSSRESVLNDKKDAVALPGPGALMATSIKSIEDHGYTVSTGIAETTGFLPFANVPMSQTLNLGIRVDLVVVSSKNNVFTFKYDPKSSSSPVKSENVLTVDSLFPGMLVKATVAKILVDGLWLNFLDYFAGSVDINNVAHTDSEAPLVFGRSDLQEWFSTGKEVSARILYINPESKRISLTLLPHILAMKPVTFASVKVGDRIENGEIRRVDEKSGLAMIVTCGGNESADGAASVVHRGYVPLAKVSDTKKERISESHYEIGMTKKVRVFGYNLLEGMLLLSHRKSDWKDPYMSYNDLKVGEVVEGTIKSVNSKGAVVTLSSNVEAFCPRVHLSDVDVTDPESRFKVGTSVTARVLRVVPDEHSAIVTFKKTLVKSTLELVTSYKAEQGIWTHGSILSILPTGLLVSFYNDVKGFVPLHELASPIEDASSPDAVLKSLRSLYKHGQVVKARVVESFPAAERMSLSFSTTISATQTEKEQARSFIAKFKVGTSLKKLEVTKREVNGLMLKYTDAKEGLTVPVIVPIHHLTDHKELAKAKLDSFKVGQVLESLHILTRRRNMLVGTMKPSLLAAHSKKALPSSFEEVTVGNVYAGYITRIFDSGALVRFGDEFCGFLAKGQMAANHHIAQVQDDFFEDQSILAEVISADAGKMQIQVSAKTDKCASKDTAFLRSYFEDLESSSKKKKDVDWTQYKVGKVIKAKVTRVETWGLSLSDSNGVSCFVHPAQIDGSPSDYAVDSSCTAVILDINYQKAILDVSLRSSLVDAAKSKSSKSSTPTKSKKATGTLEANIELVKRDYLILSYIKDGLQIFLAPTRDYNTQGYLDPFQIYKHLERVQVTLSSDSFHDLTLVTLNGAGASSSNTAAAKDAKKQTFQSDKIKTIADVSVGQVVEGLVVMVYPHRVDIALGGRVRGSLDISCVQDIALPKKGCTLEKLHQAADSKTSKGKKASSSSALAQELADLKLPSAHPFANFKLGQVVSGLTVSGFTECKSDGTFVEGLKSVPKQASDEAAASSKFLVNLLVAKSEPPKLERFSVGEIVPFWITQITSTSLNGHIGRNVRAYCSALESSHTPSVASALSTHFKPGQVVLAAVMAVEKDKEKVHLSIRAVHAEKGVSSTSGSIQEGDTTMVKIAGFKMPHLRVQVFDKIFGRVFITELSDTFEEKPMDTWTAKEGQYLNAKVLSVSKNDTTGDLHLALSLRKSLVQPSSRSASSVSNPRISSYEDVSPASKLSGYITRHLPEKNFCLVSLGENVLGHLPYAVIGSEYVKDPSKKFPVGSLVTGTILKVDAAKKQIDFAMRERGAKDSSAKEGSITYDSLEVGQLVKGVVGNIQAFGVFVKIDKSRISALCHVSLLKDADAPSTKKSKHAKKSEDSEQQEQQPQDRLSLEEIQAMFKTGDKVTAVVAKKEDDKKKVTLSMRPSDILKAKRKSSQMDSDEDEAGDAAMEASSDSSSSSASSASSSSESSSDDAIRGALQKKAAKKRQATTELPSSGSSESSESEDNAMDVDDSKSKKSAKPAPSASKKSKLTQDSESSEEHVTMHPGDDSGSEDSSDSGSGSESGSSSGESDSDDDSEDEGEGLSSGVQWDDLQFKDQISKNVAKSASSAKKAVKWDDMDVDEAAQSSEEEETSKKGVKGKKVKTVEEEMLEEAKVSAKERALLGENRLEKDADFERALMSTPNSSYVWVKWIALKLHEGNISKAREMAEMALRKIDDREDNEKFNVWVFFLNMENTYGTRESFSILLRRAAQSSKPKPIYAEAIKMLLRTDHRKEAEDIYQLILRKYKHCMSSWVNWATYHFEIKKFEQARDIFNKSLKSLVPRKHIATLTKFAQLEFRLGDNDRGRTIFETLLGNHPKRTDIWFTYADMELKYATDVERVRQIYERMISLDLNPTKMKPIFKRYLTFEASHGSPEQVNHVKEKASEYIALKSKE